MAAGSGKRKGARRAVRPKRRLRPRLLLLAAGVTLAVITWGYLVYIAIEFGADARGGEPRAWGLLGLAAAGAMASLFAGLILVARLTRAMGATSDPSVGTPPPRLDAPPPAPSSAGSHRHRAH